MEELGLPLRIIKPKTVIVWNRKGFRLLGREESSTEWPPTDRSRGSHFDPKDHRSAETGYMLGYGGFTDINAELKQFAVNSRCVPSEDWPKLITTSDGCVKTPVKTSADGNRLYAVARF